MKRPRTANDEDDTPLHMKKPFGAGLMRKRVEFVKAQDQDEGVGSLADTNNDGTAVADFYASIVFKGEEPHATDDEEGTETPPPEICEVCFQPIRTSWTTHVTSVVHQLALPASRPPSHVDRNRMGFRTLTAQGWNVDASIGLGRDGEGIRYPIKVALKKDTLGVGAVLPSNTGRVEKAKPLNAKELKEKQTSDRRRGEKLAQQMFSHSDLDRYLTKGEEWE